MANTLDSQNRSRLFYSTYDEIIEWLQTCYLHPPRLIPSQVDSSESVTSLSVWSCVWSDRSWHSSSLFLTLRMHTTSLKHGYDVFTHDEDVSTRDVCRIKKQPEAVQSVSRSVSEGLYSFSKLNDPQNSQISWGSFWDFLHWWQSVSKTVNTMWINE